MLPFCSPWQQDFQRPMDPALIQGSLAGVTLLGMNSVHHSLASSSVPSSAADSFSSFGTFICQGVFQSCIRELGAIQCLFRLISVFQDRYCCLQCKVHPADEKLGPVQPRSKIRTQGEDELTCRAHCFENLYCTCFPSAFRALWAFLANRRLSTSVHSSTNNMHLSENTAKSNIYLLTSIPQLNC